MSSNGDLFRHDPLPLYLKNRDQLVRNMVGDIESITDLDRRAAEILQGAVITPVLMDRQRATFATSRSTEGLEVKITVPLRGCARLLHHPPVGWTRQGPYGVVEAEERVSVVAGPRLRLGHRFNQALSPAQVSEWARGQIDQIQQALDLQAPMIDEYNVRVRALVEAWVAARRTVLEERQCSTDPDDAPAPSAGAIPTMPSRLGS